MVRFPVVSAKGTPDDYPTRIPHNNHQFTASADGMQHQAGVHSAVAGVLAGFCFSGVGAEAVTSMPEDAPLFLVIVDQAIMILLCLTTLLFVMSVLRCMGVEISLTSKAAARHFRAFGPALGNTCWMFHYGLVFLVLVLPLWALRKFGGCSPAFWIVTIMTALFLYHMYVSYMSHLYGLGALLQHADIGIALAPEQAAALPLSHNFTERALQLLRAAIRVADGESDSREPAPEGSL